MFNIVGAEDRGLCQHPYSWPVRVVCRSGPSDSLQHDRGFTGAHREGRIMITSFVLVPASSLDGHLQVGPATPILDVWRSAPQAFDKSGARILILRGCPQ
jgi:hypothetical protein